MQKLFLTIAKKQTVRQTDICTAKNGGNMNWFLLVLSGCIELVFTFCLGKVSKTLGYERGLWALATASAIAISLMIVTKVLKTLPIGTAYAVWTGIGAVGTVLIGIVFFKEPVSFWRLFFIATLIISIIGLKFASA